MKVEDKGTMAVEKGLKLEGQGTGGLQLRGTGWMFTGWKMWFVESHSTPQHTDSLKSTSGDNMRPTAPARLWGQSQ